MKRYISEAIGTFALVFCGTGAIVINEFTNGVVTHPGVAVTFGLIVMAMIYAFGDISGAHINPAVTIAFAYAKKFPWKDVPKYVVAQIFGAVIASGLILFLFPDSETLGATLPGIDVFRVFVFEIILSFFLMLVIINVSTGSKEIGVIAGIAIGGVVLLEALFAGPITGASMNPARSIAPALLSWQLQDLWLYILAPIVGMLLAVMSCRLVKDEQCCDEEC
ncbi:MIP/aquaporin family protein [Candidatus Ulvibacter alkanivorans]|uniref:MIP/aquaporin family protein n=1 Tax=Candidatus Ulvibacter alkanivorans TaxID=2267620 RepID=UPI000DF35DDC|nr:MIP family channel protein [Candidatus Ulvibacter alkanivorans]